MRHRAVLVLLTLVLGAGCGNLHVHGPAGDEGEFLRDDADGAQEGAVLGKELFVAGDLVQRGKDDVEAHVKHGRD